LAAATALAAAGSAAAQETVVGRPTDGAIGLQPAATQVAADVHDFHTLLMVIVTAITVLVLALLVWVVVRYNRNANATPKKFTHNVTVEVIWTIVPVIILVVIAAFSFPLLFEEERMPDGNGRFPAPTVTIKATGNAWNWGYDYPDYGVEGVIANMLPEEEAVPELYRLATDNPIYIPVGETVRILVTSNDVIHSWAMPSFGVKEDAIPGRVNEGWFKVDQPGAYYGQCSELCGTRHAFMPIEVRAVSRVEFEQWIVSQGGQLTVAPVEGAAVDSADRPS
jgi:cytochrome c oxidase subunit 2